MATRLTARQRNAAAARAAAVPSAAQIARASQFVGNIGARNPTAQGARRVVRAALRANRAAPAAERAAVRFAARSAGVELPTLAIA